MYKLTNGLREWTIDNESFKNEFLKKCYTFDINNPNTVMFYSQQDEDKYIIQYLLKDKITDGTFLEIGACDGVLYSNTKTLEDYFGFNGILIEPQLSFFENLKKNRPSPKNELYNCVVSNQDVEFIRHGPMAGIANDTNTNVQQFGWNQNHTTKIKNTKMKDLLKSSKFEYLDIMIIDVEGSELSLLQSIDFIFPIGCIFIEAHSTEQEKNKIFGNYLKENGFTFKERQRENEVWFNQNYFRKDKFNF